MQRAILFLLTLTICQCFESRPLVEYSSLTFYSDLSGDYLLSFGGETNTVASSDLWRYSLSSSKWELLPSNGSPSLFDHVAVIRTISNSMLVFGGFNPMSTWSALVSNTFLYEYFPTNNTWIVLDDNFVIASDNSATYVESLDALVVYGSEYPDLYNSLQYYFLGNKSWSTIPTQNHILRYTLVNAIYMPETQTVYSLGGYNGSTVENLQILAQFTSVSVVGNNSWTTLKNPGPIANAVLTASYPYIYAYGGCRQYQFSISRAVYCADISSDLMKYNVRTGEWIIEETNDMRFGANGVLTPKRVLYIYGGQNRENKVIGDLQALDLSEPVIEVESDLNGENDRTGVMVGSTLAGVVAVVAVVVFVVYKKKQNGTDLSTIPLVSRTQNV